MGCIRTGQGPTLVLVHGFLSGLHYWDKQIEKLSTHFDVIAMDLPGYGGEVAKTGHNSIPNFALSVIEKLNEMGVREFHLIGHSMGGMIAQEIALQVPDRVARLVLYGTGPMGDLPGRFESLAESMEKVQQLGTSDAKSYTVESWFQKGKLDPNFLPGLELAKGVSLQTYVNGLEAMGNWSAVDRLGQILAKTLVIWGDKDKSYIWNQPYLLWQEIKDSSLAVIPDCSHNVHLEKDYLFNTIVFDFLTYRVPA